MSATFQKNPYRPFKRVLIANRGEIACRIIRSAHALGLQTVAVFSDVDRDSLHVAMADHAVFIGESAAASSYLNIEAICAAISQSGADAVHPGYGFLAENAAFAEAVLACGAVWVGPAPRAVRDMGNKAHAKTLMLAAGVRCIPGYEGEDQSDANLLEQAAALGFPIMVKASAGGGGRGMRLVVRAEDLPVALERARIESMQAFGSDALILERAMTSARHVEIQIAGDVFGNVIHLGERDCSVQRRHQKLIEESPSPAVDAELRARMGAMAVMAARAIQYVGLGTIECLLDDAGDFYFMEMNTRLQVEHAVTEAIYGVDLVALQFELAAGYALKWSQEQIQFESHAIEVRLNAEDVAAGFLPQSGTIWTWQSPEHLDGIRVDHCLRDGTYISPYYDSMIAKVIAVGENREQALSRLSRALRHCVVLGIPSNQPFLSACLNHPEFVSGQITTDFVDRQRTTGLLQDEIPAPRTIMWAAVAALGLTDVFFPDGKSSVHQYERHLKSVESGIGLRYISCEDPLFSSWQILIKTASDGSLLCKIGNEPDQHPEQWTLLQYLPHGFSYHQADGYIFVFDLGRAWTFQIDNPRTGRSEQKLDGVMRAPLSARVSEVFVQAGQVVQSGQVLAVLEAMKMEHAMHASFEGVVSELLVRDGDQVRMGTPLMTITATDH